MKKIKAIIISLILVTIAYQATMAVLHKTGNVDTSINAGTLGIEIIDGNYGKGTKRDKGFEFHSALPGSELKQELKIKNTKDNDLYVRVIITKYWNNSENKKETNADAKFLELITNDKDNWFIVDNSQSSNSEETVFYYKKPLKSQESSTFFINAVKLSEEITDNKYTQYYANIDIEANAIQKAGAKEAMLSEWGIDAKINEEGIITSIVE